MTMKMTLHESTAAPEFFAWARYRHGARAQKAAQGVGFSPSASDRARRSALSVIRLQAVVIGLYLVVLAPSARGQIDFQARRDFLGTTNGPGDVFSGDFDGDGLRDLASLVQTGIDFYQGRGDGTFQTTRNIPSARAFLGAAGDVNADGWMDIVATRDNILAYLGTGGPTIFSMPVESISDRCDGRPVLGDLNEDGFLDVVTADGCAEQLSLFLGDGSGGFSFLSALPAFVFVLSPVVEDLDRDGHLDIAISLGSPPRVDLHFGRGDGSFEAPRSVPLAREICWMISLDANNDGAPDLAGYSGFFGAVALLVNNGAGSFGAPVLFEGGAATANRIGAGDLNSDGLPDVVVLGNDPARTFFTPVVSWILSDGSGGYGEPRVEREGYLPFGLALDDLNGDGHPDVVTSASQGSDLAVHLGDGLGGLGPFARSITVPFNREFVGSVAADWNRDGFPDVVVAQHGGLDDDALLFAGQPDGSLVQLSVVTTSHAGRDLVDGDFDGDGLLDVALVDKSVGIFFGDGAGGFSAAPARVLPSDAAGIDRGDFNEDGLLDVVVTLPAEDQVWILAGDGLGGFLTPAILGGDFRSVTAADVDGDGHLDYGLTGGSSGSRVYFGNGAGWIVRFEAIPHQASGAKDMALVDMDGDSLVDVAVYGSVPSFELGRLSIVRNSSGRTFQFVENHVVPDSPSVIEPLDADGDGIVDLACASQVSTNVRVLRGRGDGTFETPPFSFGCGVGVVGLRMAVADFDGDGRSDIVVPTSGSGDLSVLYNRTPQHPGKAVRCLEGGVNAGRGTLADVLLVNGSAGDPTNRSLSLGTTDSLQVSLAQPPSRRTKPKSNFALFAWTRVPSDERVVALPLETGCLAFPIPATGGGPQPRRTWNNLGHFPLLGVPDFPSSPAPSTPLNLPEGLGARATFTLQGLIRDDGSRGRKGVSPTNGIVVRVQ